MLMSVICSFIHPLSDLWCCMGATYTGQRQEIHPGQVDHRAGTHHLLSLSHLEAISSLRSTVVHGFRTLEETRVTGGSWPWHWEKMQTPHRVKCNSLTGIETRDWSYNNELIHCYIQCLVAKAMNEDTSDKLDPSGTENSFLWRISRTFSF